ncbi:hypothetical protein G3O08_10375 [Cryomorpha ignava]|uniref:Uncharacterized protein n=1 Tax=Cryomorpha ignava TaxID=101383 RepID=A0A7K3WR13_9FLAO|nr:DUF6702 family protein [Cryomorpha ignava]NEN23904.1 hypothetical protein [Cryomorpha ignava]
MKMLLILFLGMLNVSASTHEFYVGMTEIRYSENSQSYQITLKLFTDDLENAIYKASGDSLNLGNPKELPQSDNLISNYLRKHLSLEDGNENPLTLNDVGRETELDVTWIYFESQEMKPQDALRIKNDIFMEMHPEQTHIVNLIQKGITTSTLLHSAKTEALLKP